MKRGLLGFALAVAAVATLTEPSSAAGFRDILDPCRPTNCAVITLPGMLFRDPEGAGAWVAEVYAGTNECLRLQVLDSSLTNLRMTVVAPDGTVYRNDDDPTSVGCPKCPLVKVRGTPNAGSYTVVVSSTGGASAVGTFTLAYGRYRPATNQNCRAPTPAE